MKNYAASIYVHTRTYTPLITPHSGTIPSCATTTIAPADVATTVEPMQATLNKLTLNTEAAVVAACKGS